MYYPIFKRRYFIKSIDPLHVLKLTNFPFNVVSRADPIKIKSEHLNQARQQLMKISLSCPNLYLFLQNAPEKLILDLSLSYYYHKYLDYKNVLNVETLDWTSIPFFANEHVIKIKQNGLRKRGKHSINLRYDRVHLAVDYVNGKKIFQIHWDNFYPSNPLRFISHIIRDNIWG